MQKTAEESLKCGGEPKLLLTLLHQALFAIEASEKEKKKDQLRSPYHRL